MLKLSQNVRELPTLHGKLWLVEIRKPTFIVGWASNPSNIPFDHFHVPKLRALKRKGHNVFIKDNQLLLDYNLVMCLFLCFRGL